MPTSTSTGSIPQVPTFCVLGTRAPMTMPIGIVASSPSTSTHATVNHPDGSAMRLSKSRKLGTRITTICGKQRQRLEEQLPGEVAAQAVRHRLVPQQGAVLLLHRQRVGRADDHPEGDEGAEDAGQRHRGQQQVGALDLGVAPQEQVAHGDRRREEVEALVLGAADALRELGPAALGAEPDRVPRGVHRRARARLGPRRGRAHRATSAKRRAAASPCPASCCWTSAR